MADTATIETNDLRKHYDRVEALRGLNLHVQPGSICGFLGRNGAGKTTTMKILLGMVRPTSGEAHVFGLAADSPQESLEIRRRSAFVSEEKDLYPYMTVDEIVRFTAPLFSRWRKDLQERYLRKFDLPLTRRIKTFSRGTRTKVALLLALCRGAELLVLDEPTSGLDPASAEQVLQALVAHAGSEQMTVFFSSQQISEIDQIADCVVIIERGRVVVDGALDDLREKFRRIHFVFDHDAPEVTFRACGVERVTRNGRVLTVLSSAGVDPILEEARPLHPRSIDVVPVTLKEIFLETVNAED